jgi:hypothetical protein
LIIDLLNPRDIGVKVTSWLMNWPHCITIMVSIGVSADDSWWTEELTRRGLGRAFPETDFRSDSIPLP